MQTKILLPFLILFASLATVDTLAGDYTVRRSTEQTSGDFNLEFKMDKVVWRDSRGKIYIWGVVENSGNIAYRFFKVIFTIKDSSDYIIGQYGWYTKSFDIGSGQVGYIEEAFIDCGERKPSTIEWKVIGKE